MGDVSLVSELQRKIEEAQILLDNCKILGDDRNIDGAQKLQKKIESEMSFFKGFENNHNKLKPSHLACSNLVHLGAIVKVALRYPDCVSILKPFSCNGNAAQNSLVVDVVVSGGSEWVKVVARNAEGLHRAWAAGDSRRERNIADQAKEYLQAAQSHPHMFRKPKIIFEFLSGVPDRLAEDMRGKGVDVRGEVISSDSFPNWIVEESSSDEDLDSSDIEEEALFPEIAESDCLPENMPLNLDITAIFAYVSALTNGGANFKFQETLLDEQAAWERQRPVLAKLQKITEGRKLICCETAKESFQEILRTVGGVSEIQRSEELFRSVEVLPDRISERTKKLKLGGKIKSRSLTIFGSGDFYKALTLTANRGFVHAAANQGVQFAVILHESRALSEQKQLKASPLD